MPILRNPTKDRFTVVDNQLIEDDRLSADALGIAVYLFSKPDGWKIVPAELAGRFGIGRDKVRKIQRQLEHCGYMQLRQRRAADGQVAGTEWVLVEPGADPNNPNADLFSGDNREPESQAVGGEEQGGQPSDREPESQGLGTESLRDRLSVKTESREIRPLVNTETDSKYSIAGSAGASKRRTRKRDPAFDALCTFEGVDPGTLTRSAAGAIGSALRDIRESWEAEGGDHAKLPAEIHDRGGRYLKLFEVRPTAPGLAKHWPKCTAPKPKPPREESEDERVQRELREARSDAISLIRLMGGREDLEQGDGETTMNWAARVRSAWREHCEQTGMRESRSAV